MLDWLASSTSMPMLLPTANTCAGNSTTADRSRLAADKIAVDAFCPRFSKGFHIFETVTVTGTFVLTEGGSNAEISSIASDGTSCHGVDGYSDIDPNTQVIVRNGTGEILHTTPLGEGHGDDLTCTFSFGVPVTEGQDRYVVSVSRRGDFIYTFNQ